MAADLPWPSPNRYRLLLEVDCRGVSRSNSPATVDADFARSLSEHGISGRFDEHTIEVIAYDRSGTPRVFDPSRPGYERYLLPWRLQKYYPVTKVTLSFVVPDETCHRLAVYFDTLQSGLGKPRRYAGLVGDGDFFRQEFQRREIGATHFDTFCDLDGDGDLDLLTGGVEPFVYCYENVGQNRFVDRGRLTSGGALLTLPKNDRNNRSWVVPHFCDWDRDGDQDFFPSFMDGPYAGKIVFFENVTQPGGQLTFVDRGPLKTVSGTPVAGGKQAGGWFPSVVFVKDFNGARGEHVDVLLGSNNHCYLYRNLGPDGTGGWRLADAVAIQAAGKEIELFNPCFEVADIDHDGDWDLFAASQAGQIYLYENIDQRTPRSSPVFAGAALIAYDQKQLQASGHPRVTVADFTGDGLLDLVVDRAWELADLGNPSQKRDYGALFRNIGTATSPKWQRVDATRWAGTASAHTPHRRGAPFTETFQICDALRQNVVRAVDWNNDGRTDLLAGDCDGFVWLFFNRTGNRFPLFAEGRRLSAGGEPLSLAGSGGHARPDVCDWNNDGRKDLVCADGAGTVTVYLNEGTDADPVLGRGRKAEAYDAEGELKPIHRGSRAHLMVCDFNHDGKKDLIFSDQENPGFYFFRNVQTDADPRFAAAKHLGLSRYQRPNLGSFVDWDGDGKRDLIACQFEHSIRFYKDEGSGQPGEEPNFSNPHGISIVKPYSIMMISGADVVDFNGDGDLDVLTGQGHGGSGLRFYERDYIEDCLHDTHPIVRVASFQTHRQQDSGPAGVPLLRQKQCSTACQQTVAPKREAGKPGKIPFLQANPSLLDVVRRYADAMIEHGRDTYGQQKSGLLLSALDRGTLKPLQLRPAPPGGIRREDRAGLPWRALHGANPQLDQNLLRALYTLSEITGEPRYREVADEEIRWFFQNAQSPVTGLLPWGEHLAWDVMLDRPISGSTDLTHEFSRPWVLWDESFRLAPEAAKRFALGLWNHQIADQKTGAFDRHAPYNRHGPVDGKDFPRHGAFYIHTWAYAYKHTKGEIFLRAIESVLARFERKRSGPDGAMHSTMGPLDIETAAAMVPEPLATRLRRFAQTEDRLILEDLHRLYGPPEKGISGFGDVGISTTAQEPRSPEIPKAANPQTPMPMRTIFPELEPTWEAGYSSGVTADWAMFGWARYQQVKQPEFRDLVIAVADTYVDTLPAEDVDVWPMSFSHIISAEVAAYKLTGRSVYLDQARRFARMAVEVFFEDNPLPRASVKTGHYETITGADSLALSLLEVHAASNHLEVAIPANTIDR